MLFWAFFLLFIYTHGIWGLFTISHTCTSFSSLIDNIPNSMVLVLLQILSYFQALQNIRNLQNHSFQSLSSQFYYIYLMIILWLQIYFLSLIFTFRIKSKVSFFLFAYNKKNSFPIQMFVTLHLYEQIWSMLIVTNFYEYEKSTPLFSTFPSLETFSFLCYFILQTMVFFSAIFTFLYYFFIFLIHTWFCNFALFVQSIIILLFLANSSPSECLLTGNIRQ